MSIKGIYIHYINGARGDFLASILSNTEKGFKFHLSKKSQISYVKQHHLSQSKFPEFPEVDITNYLKIIIIPTTPRCLIEIAYLRMVKKFSDSVSPENLKWQTHGIYEDICTDKKNYNNYDIIVPFKNLFDINYIKDLYYKIHGVGLADDEVTLIKENIDQQPKLEDNSEFINMIALLLAKYKDFKIEL